MKFILILFSLFCLQVVYTQNFNENLKNDSIGEWPRNWDAVNGSVTVNAIQSQKVIDIANKAIIKPIVDDKTDNYLGDTFTIEFDAFFEEDIYMEYQHYQIRFWDGFGYNAGNTRMTPINIRRNGARIMIANPNERVIESYTNHTNPKNLYDSEKRLFGETWRHIKLTYDKGYVKLYIDEEQIFIIPRFPIKPTMFSIGATEITSDNKNRLTAITNIKLTDEIVKNQPIVNETSENPSDTSTQTEQENESANSITKAAYRFKFDWLVVYEAYDGGLGNTNLELYSKSNNLNLQISQGTNGLDGGTIWFDKGIYKRDMAQIDKSDAYSIAKNDGALLPVDEVIFNIDAKEFGFDSIEEFESNYNLTIEYTVFEKDPSSKDEVFQSRTSINFSGANIIPLTMQEVLNARNQDVPGILKFQKGPNRLGVSFTFEKLK